MNTSGSVWNNKQINLAQPFDFWFNVFLGCSDAGADGIVFILQTVNNSVGRNGSGLGFANVSPSIGIALDTYQNIDRNNPDNNLNDPAYDHISIQANGMVRHENDLAGPIRASATSDNIEDCQWHTLRIAWNPATKMLQAYFDGALRVEANIDLSGDIFRGNPNVYWGFSGATGGLTNLQQFCTALNPSFITDATNDGVCIGNAIGFTDSSVSFAPIASYHWDMGDGTTFNTAQVPPHTYVQPGDYKVKLAITGLDGCKSDTITKNITIATPPKAQFSINDTCFKATPRITFSNANVGTTTQWLLNGTLVSASAQPNLSNLQKGNYNLKTIVTSHYGCGSDETERQFTIKPSPEIEATVMDACIKIPVTFNGQQRDNETTITSWNWRFGNGMQSNLQQPAVVYNKGGSFTMQLWATASNGCTSDTISKNIQIVEALAFAGNDTIVLNNVPFQLKGSGNGIPFWSPATGLDRNDTYTPTGQLTTDATYFLNVVTPEGCIAVDTVQIEVFKGSAIYVPTAFTPDGNGLNDYLIPKYIGIKSIRYFTIFNRWGQQVFTTTQAGRGWDGKIGGKEVAAGTFVWLLHAEDIGGKVYQLKGTFTLLR